MKPACLCCWSDHDNRGIYCEPCVAFHGRVKLAPKDANGDTTCPEAMRTSRERAERLAAMPATVFKQSATAVETLEFIDTIIPRVGWRGNF